MSSNSTENENTGSAPDGMPDFEAFSKMSADLYRQWEQSVSQWWDQVVESPAFLDGAGKSMAGLSQMRAKYESQVDDNLARMHLPSRGDITRLARIANLLERRLLDVEDNLLAMKDELARRDERAARIEAELVQARIEAVEARIEQRQRLDALQARLDALEAAPASKARPTPSRKSSASKASPTE